MSRLDRTFKAGRGSVPPFYHPTSFFSRPLGPTDTLAADQTPAQHLGNQINYGRQSGWSWGTAYTGPGYGNYQWPGSVAFNGPGSFSHPVFCVRPSVAAQQITYQKVSLYYGSGPYFSYSPAQLAGIDAHLASVPIPNKALCPAITGSGSYADIWAGGSDQSCFIWNLDTDEGFEFELLSNNKSAVQSSTGTTWNALWAGYIPSVSAFMGVLPNQWGARACSLGEIGGLITMQDLRDVAKGGAINHAIVIACPMNGGTSAPVAPATRSDGPGPNGNNVATIPNGFPGAGGANPAYHQDVTWEAQRFRFPASLNLDANGSITPYPLALAIARAIQTYGLYITDTAGAVGFYFEDDRTVGSPYHMQGATAVHPWSLSWPGGDPRYGGAAIGTGFTVLNQLPWSQLQALNPISS